MRKINFVVLRPFVLLLLVPFVFAQPGALVTRTQIDAYAKKVGRYTDHHRKGAIAFADLSPYGSSSENWKKVGSWDDLDGYTADHDAYSLALVWKQNGKVTAANFTYTSPSGDWNDYVNHYFRPDGTLALVTSEFRTFANTCVAKQRVYFDRKGILIRKTVSYSDLETGRRKAPCLSDESLKFNYYQSVITLPFSGLLNGK
ncbi:MAG TPA: hypothetical protein VL325_04335 [Pyrinomonadaceae bacterium]|jgi:hypothetical protein|nr:hypothetical protein [Pyrinomonadaceae bacterium]